MCEVREMRVAAWPGSQQQVWCAVLRLRLRGPHKARRGFVASLRYVIAGLHHQQPLSHAAGESLGWAHAALLRPAPPVSGAGR